MAVDWKDVGEKLVQEIQKNGGVMEAAKALKWISDNYVLPPRQLTEAWGKYQTMNLVRRALETSGAPLIPTSSKTHPKTGEISPNLESGWLVLVPPGGKVPTASAAVTPAPTVPKPVARVVAPAPVIEPVIKTPPPERMALPADLIKLIPKSDGGYIPRIIWNKMSDVDLLKKSFTKGKCDRAGNLEACPQNILLIGPPGGGKTHVAKVLAYELQLPYRRVEMHGGTEVSDLIGYYAPASTPEEKAQGSYVWVDGTLTKMCQYGGVFLADEINAMPRTLGPKLHGLLDRERRLVIPEVKGGKIIEAVPDFVFIAAMNPGVPGMFPLTEAMKDRFELILEYDYDPKVETQLIKNKKLLDFAHKIREDIKNKIGGMKTIVSTRMLLQYQDNEDAYGIEVAKRVLVNKWDTQKERDHVEEVFDAVVSGK